MKRTEQEIDQLLEQGLKELRGAELPSSSQTTYHPSRRWAWSVAAGVVIVALVAMPRLGAKPAYAIEDVVSGYKNAKYRIARNVGDQSPFTNAYSVMDNSGRYMAVSSLEWTRRLPGASYLDEKFAAHHTWEGKLSGFQSVIWDRDGQSQGAVGEKKMIQNRLLFDGEAVYSNSGFDNKYFKVPSSFERTSSSGNDFSFDTIIKNNSRILKSSKKIRSEKQSSGKSWDVWHLVTDMFDLYIWVDAETKLPMKDKQVPKQPTKAKTIEHVYEYPESVEPHLFEIPEGAEIIETEKIAEDFNRRAQDGIESVSAGKDSVVLRGLVSNQRNSIVLLFSGMERLTFRDRVKIEVNTGSGYRLLASDSDFTQTLSRAWLAADFSDDLKRGYLPKAIQLVEGVPIYGQFIKYSGYPLPRNTMFRITLPHMVKNGEKPVMGKDDRLRGYLSKVDGEVVFTDVKAQELEGVLWIDNLYEKL